MDARAFIIDKKRVGCFIGEVPDSQIDAVIDMTSTYTAIALRVILDSMYACLSLVISLGMAVQAS